MKIGVKIKEKIAKTIAEHFTTSEIISVFADLKISTNQSLYAKWRIILDAFSRVETEEDFFYIIGQFCHPLNFEDKKSQVAFVDALNKILLYEDIEIQYKDKTVNIVSIKGGPQSDFSKSRPKTKTSTDYVIEAINFFKNEYNKVRVSGLSYEYDLGQNFAKANDDIEEEDADKHTFKLKALEQLKNVGFIKDYEIEERVINEGYYVWDYAICKIDESKITQKEAPKATAEGVEALTKKVIHEHTHRFENSIQEKEIDLNHKFVEDDVLVKNKKKISLPKFSSTEWSKIEIRFIDKDTVYMKAGQKTATADYESLGFRNDKNGKPNTAWHFLFELAKRNGETQAIPSPVPDSIKQQKRALSDRLKTIFKNDTDPFNDFSEANTYKIKLKLLPPTDKEKPDNLGVDDYLKETMTSQYEPEAKE